MSRIVPIRISQADQNEYKRLVRNAKAKIRRTKNKYNRDLDSVVDLSPIDSFKTRSEFNAFKDSLKSFTNRGNLDYQYIKNKYDVTISKKEISEIKELTKDAQRLYDNGMPNVVDLKMSNRDITVGQRMLQMKSENNSPRAFNVNNYRSMTDIKRDRQRLEKKTDPHYYDERINRMRENFITKLEFSFNDDADQLINDLKNMSLTHFYAFFKMNEGGVFDFDLYDSEQSVVSFGNVETGGTPMSEMLVSMMGEMQRYNEGKYDMDFADL